MMSEPGFPSAVYVVQVVVKKDRCSSCTVIIDAVSAAAV
jgi:hypothetical protein